MTSIGVSPLMTVLRQSLTRYRGLHQRTPRKSAIPSERPTSLGVPAEAGTHRSTASSLDGWVPAVAGTPKEGEA
jgi:hypothetical protein